MLYLGWILAAFFAGLLLAERRRKGRRSLRERFSRVEVFRGRSYPEVLAIAGHRPRTVIRQADGTSQRVWREGEYFIELSFDARDVCLGVIDERL